MKVKVLLLGVAGLILASLTLQGVTNFCLAGQEWEWITGDDGLPEEYVYTIKFSDGMVFVGTDKGGAKTEIRLAKEKWGKFLVGIPIYSIIFGSQGEIICGSDKLYLSTDNGKTWNLIENTPTFQKISDMVYVGDTLWVGDINGVYTYSPTFGWKTETGLKEYGKKSFAKTPQEIFVGVYGKGVYYRKYQEQEWTYFNVRDYFGSWISNQVNDLIFFKGKLWGVSESDGITALGGIFTYDGQWKQIFPVVPGDPYASSHARYFTTLSPDSSGSIWFGGNIQGNGAYRLNAAGKWYRFKAGEWNKGLMYNKINFIAVDSLNRKWFGHKWGITLLTEILQAVEIDTTTIEVGARTAWFSLIAPSLEGDIESYQARAVHQSPADTIRVTIDRDSTSFTLPGLQLETEYEITVTVRDTLGAEAISGPIQIKTLKEWKQDEGSTNSSRTINYNTTYAYKISLDERSWIIFSTIHEIFLEEVENDTFKFSIHEDENGQPGKEIISQLLTDQEIWNLTTIPHPNGTDFIHYPLELKWDQFNLRVSRDFYISVTPLSSTKEGWSQASLGLYSGGEPRTYKPSSNSWELLTWNYPIRCVWKPGTPVTPDPSPHLVPQSYILEQNFPNPFNSETTIKISVPTTQKVALKIYNLLGQEVATLVDEVVRPGNWEASWDGKDYLGRECPSGTYLYCLQAEDFIKTKKMTLLR